MNERSLLRNRLFAVVVVVSSTLLSLVAAELLLRQQTTSVEDSSQLDDGLIQYDAVLGWRLSPVWSGRHRHHDFDVTYSTDLDGRRSSPAAQLKVMGGPRTYWLGDSFTFGLGVADADTFLNQLNLLDEGVEHINMAVPGYSTDQQLLQLEKQLLPRGVKDVVLVTYLGNDLFDNLLAFPLQAEHGKPYFQLRDGRLLRRNVPVPATRKGEQDHLRTLSSMAWGDQPPQASFLDWLAGLHVSKLAGLSAPLPSGFEAMFRKRHRPTVDLYMAQVKRMQDALQARGGDFRVVLLPGRSAVEQPAGLSAHVQLLLARMIVEKAHHQQDLLVSDLTPALQAASESLYHPNEGHLNARGNRVVAELLRESR